MANLLFAKELSRRFAGTSKTANAVHPGVIATNLGRDMNPVARWGMKAVVPIACKSIAQGAATQVFVATHPSQTTTTGQYFADCNVATPRADANDEALAARLWDVSEKIVAELPRG